MERAINLLIKEEDSQARATQLSLLPVKRVNGPKIIGRTILSQFLVKSLGDGRPRSLAELEELAKAENIDFQGKKPKRVLHFALIGLKHNNYARMVERSVWQLTEKALAKQETADNSRELEVKEEATTVAGR